VKYVVHQRLLVPQGHVPEAKMGGLVRLVHSSALHFPVIASEAKQSTSPPGDR
jgi:hypothetical protein